MKTENRKTSKTPLIIADIDRFECGICLGILYNATSCDPCLHSFCAGCIGQWFKENPFCPLCKVASWELRPNWYIDKLVKKFVKQNPGLERSSEDKMRSDEMEREYLCEALRENQREVKQFSGNDDVFVDLKRKCEEKGQRISRRLWKPTVHKNKKNKRNENSCDDEKTHFFVANIVVGAFSLIPLMVMVWLVYLFPLPSFAFFLFMFVVS